MVEIGASELKNPVVVVDEEESKDGSISELISFLKTALQPMDFDKVERMLVLREEKFTIDKKALETQMKGNLEDLKAEHLRREVELEEKLQAYRTRWSELEERNWKVEEGNRGLSMELENNEKECVSPLDKLGGLGYTKGAIEDELSKCKRTCEELKLRLTRLEEDHKVMCEREKRAQERIITSSGEKYVQSKEENRDLEREKRKAVNKVEIWKKKFTELESLVVRLEEETLVLNGKDPLLPANLEVEPGDFSKTASYKEKEKKEVSTSSKISDEANDSISSACLVHPQFKEKTLNCEGVTDASLDVRSTCLSPVNGSRHEQDTGSPSIYVPYESLFNVAEEKKKNSSENKVQYGTRVRKQLVFGQDGSSNRKMASFMPVSVRLASRDIIEISDSDEEMDNPLIPTSNIRDKGTTSVSVTRSLKGVLDNEGEITSNKCLKEIHSDHGGEENGSSCEEDSQFALTPKRKRTSNIVTSDSEVDDDEDKIPLGKLKMKKLQDLVNESVSSVNQNSSAPIVSSGNDNVEDSVTPSRRRLVSLRQCEERKTGVERTSPSHLRTIGTKNENLVEPTAENTEEEHKVEKLSSDSEGESLGGFIVDGSDGSDRDADSEDIMDSDEAFDQVISRIRRSKDNKMEWTFEADMLSSFQRDPELCMKAVCALYRQQTTEEKSMKGSLYSNKRGFSKFDALRGTMLAEFLTDGDTQGEVKKSVKELEKYDPKALEECRRLATHYSRQLFMIYQNKEDPFFS